MNISTCKNNYKSTLEKLNFHDSEICSLNMEYHDNGDRSLDLIIDYYNWEGNEHTSGEQWVWKKLKITFGFVAVFDWNAPDYLNTKISRTILQANYDKGLDKLYDLELERESKSKVYKSKVFNNRNYASIEFIMCDFDKGLRADEGYIWVVGSDVSYEMYEGDLQGQIHIDIGKNDG